MRKVPTNARAHCNLAIALVGSGRLEEATAHYAESLRLEPNSANTRYNHGLSLAKLGRLSEAAAEYEAALKLAPDLAEARCNYGVVLLASGRRAEALRQFQPLPLQLRRARVCQPLEPPRPGAPLCGRVGHITPQLEKLGSLLGLEVVRVC